VWVFFFVLILMVCRPEALQFSPEVSLAGERIQLAIRAK
jgi:hypothetical protein